MDFYARRMRRLLPAALVVIVVTLADSAVILTPLRLTEVAGDAAASALYVSNFRFALEATDYLSLDAPSPLLHYWSLGVEEQFYLVWPLILLVVVRASSRGCASGLRARAARGGVLRPLALLDRCQSVLGLLLAGHAGLGAGCRGAPRRRACCASRAGRLAGSTP